MDDKYIRLEEGYPLSAGNYLQGLPATAFITKTLFTCPTSFPTATPFIAATTFPVAIILKEFNLNSKESFSNLLTGFGASRPIT